MKKAALFLALLISPCMAQAQQQGPVQTQPVGVQAMTAQQLEQAKLDGEIAAMNTGGWMGRSLAFGFLGGVIGTGITFAVAAGSSPDLPTEKKILIANQSPIYQTMYEKGYADKVRSKRKKTALAGGLIGTAASLVLILSLNSSSTGY